MWEVSGGESRSVQLNRHLTLHRMYERQTRELSIVFLGFSHTALPLATMCG